MERGRNTDTQKQNPEAMPAIPQGQSIKNKEERDTEAKDRGNEASEFWTIFGSRIKITDSVLALFTFLLFIATCLLFYSGEKAADAAKKAAEAANSSAKTAREALISTQRAVIVMTQSWTFPIGTPVVGYSFHISFKNAGPTIAKKTRILSRLRYFDKPLPDDYDYAFDPPADELEKSLRNSGDIGRDTPFNSIVQGLSLEQIENIRRGKAAATYQFYILYNDIFDGTPLHHTAATMNLKILRDPDPKILLGLGVGGQNTGLFDPEMRWTSAD